MLYHTIIEPAHNKAYSKTCVTSKGYPLDFYIMKLVCTSFQYGKSSFVSLSIAWRLQVAQAISEDSDQTVRMRRLIWVLSGRTSLIVVEYYLVAQVLL